MNHRATRRRVVDMCRTMLDRGYLKATEGNVSVRVPGHRRFAVTPSNYGYERMRLEDIRIVDFSGRLVPDDADAPSTDDAGTPATDDLPAADTPADDGPDGSACATASAELAPSIECSMHAGVYSARPDVNAIVHTHQPYASALAFLRKPIPALTDEQARFLGRRVAIIDYAPSGTGFLARNVVKQVASGDNAFILANHGVLALGTDPDRAVFNMALLEKVSIAYLLSLATEAGRVYTIPAAIREIAFAKLRRDERRIAAQITQAVPPVRVPDSEALPSSADAATAGTGTPGAVASASEPARLGYAIGSYLDVEDTMRRLAALVAQPVRGLRHDALLDVLRYFDTRCRASRELTDRARRRIPGGVQHNLAFNYPFPLAIARAEGAWLTDVDGNAYIDFLQAGGPTILGSNYGPVNERVAEVIGRSGPVTGLFHEYELKLAEIIHRYLPHVEMYRALGSGTEAVMAAVRAARAFTGRKMVIKIGGAYHGWSDTMVYGLRVPGTFRMNAKGIPFGATGRTRESFPHSLGQLRRKLIENRLRGGTAAVIVEPLGPESGTRPVPYDFNANVRRLCDEFGALLIFDEVVTGFRIGMGGAAGYFGVAPDLTVLGKAVSGGYPMAGGVGGRADVMATFGSGLDSAPTGRTLGGDGGAGSGVGKAGGGGRGGGRRRGGHIQVGGTLSANPLSCAAGYFAIEEMARTNAPVIAGRAGDRLTRGLQRLIDRYGLPYVAYNQGSIVHLECSGVMLLDTRHPLKLLRENSARKRLMEQMGAAYTAHGIVTLAGSRMYTSMADTDEVIDDALDRFDQVFALVEGA